MGLFVYNPIENPGYDDLSLHHPLKCPVISLTDFADLTEQLNWVGTHSARAVVIFRRDVNVVQRVVSHSLACNENTKNSHLKKISF